MNRTEHIEFARQLLERMEIDGQNPKIGHLVAGHWAGAALAHALMAHSGMGHMTNDDPAETYDAAASLDLEEGGGERWRQGAYAAYELSQAFCYGLRTMTSEEIERKTESVACLAAELLDRLDPGWEQAGMASHHPNSPPAASGSEWP